MGPRFLAYVAGLVLLLGLFERSDLLTPAGLVGLMAAMALVTIGSFGLALRQASENRLAALTPSYYLIPLMAVVVAGAVSALVSDWRLHAGSQAAMAAAIFVVSFVTVARLRGQRQAWYDLLQDVALLVVVLVSYVVILAGINDILLRLTLIFAVSLVAAYENLSRATSSHGRALVGGVIVAQLVTGLAFALISQQFLDVVRLGPLLLVAWYVNRGMSYHVLEGTMSIGVFVEYVIGAVVCAVLVATALTAR
ncbi:MAG: hypothetical protein M3Z98_11445 [Candidatus Dormibacteraeota bacterium]|nr:hypothetical protein [Candidatus Dormibacteraeota bacterium]